MTGTRDGAEQVRVTPEEIADARWWSEALRAEHAREWFVVILLDVPEPDAKSIAEQTAEHGDLMTRYLDRWAVLIRMQTENGIRQLAQRWIGGIPNAGLGVADSRARKYQVGSYVPLDDMLAVAYAESLVCRTGA